MSSENPEILHLALFLDAPLQSWGCQSKFDYRGTLAFPTRSGVIGLLCAALGIPADDRNGIAEINSLEFLTIVFEDKSGIIMADYHTVGAGYDKKTQRGFIPDRTAVTQREYLHNARFGIIVSGIPEIINRCKDAVENPQWGIWFGRKSCIPSSPLCRGVFPAFDMAQNALIKAGGKILRTYQNTNNFTDSTDTLMDVPIDFRAREFRSRHIMEVSNESDIPEAASGDAGSGV